MPVTILRPSQFQHIPLNTNILSVLKVDPTEVTYSNSAAETTIWTYTLPAGVLGASDQLLLVLFLSILNSSGAIRTITNRFYFGGTQITAPQDFPFNTGTTSAAEIHVSIKNNGATNAQKVVHKWSCANDTFATADGAFGTAAKDTTLAQQIKFTLQSDVATATQTFNQQLALAYFLKNT